jgi:uncharacterized membrane protein
MSQTRRGRQLSGLSAQLTMPQGEDFNALRPLLRVFFSYSYVLSSLYIGIYWNNHHHMLHAVKHVSGGQVVPLMLFENGLPPFGIMR